MITRKLLTTVFATLISITFILVFVFGEGKDLIDFIMTLAGTSLMFSPVILLYGVPVTFFSDYITKRFTGTKRALSAMIIHLIFGLSFGILLRIFSLVSKAEAEILIIAATTTSFFFWFIDEILRLLLPNKS